MQTSPCMAIGALLRCYETKEVLANRKIVRRLMQIMNLRAIYPGPNTSKRNLQELVHPYLLSSIPISRLNQVWQVDIAYLRTNAGFMYLIDVYSRLVVGH